MQGNDAVAIAGLALEALLVVTRSIVRLATPCVMRLSGSAERACSDSINRQEQPSHTVAARHKRGQRIMVSVRRVVPASVPHQAFADCCVKRRAADNSRQSQVHGYRTVTAVN